MIKTVEETPLMRIFKLGVEDSRLDEFLAIGQHNLIQSIQKESGTLAMYASHQEGQPLATVIVEIYRDQAAYEKHIAASHFQAFASFAKEGLTDRQVIETSPLLLLEKEQPLLELAASPVTVKLAEIDVKPESLSDFLAIVTDEMKTSLEKEPGVLVMYVTQVLDEPNSLRFFEVYQDQAAYDSHRQTPHFKAYIEQTADLVQDKKLFNLAADTLVNQGGLYFEGEF